MKKEIDIHDYPKKLQAAISYVEKAPISQRNKKLISDFKDDCSLIGMGLPRIVRYLQVLPRLAKILSIDFDKATKSDVAHLVRTIQENERHSPWTKYTYKVMLKRFFKWLKDTWDTYPEEVKWIKPRIKPTDKRLPANGDLLTEEEIKKLIEAAEHPRDKAFVSVLYESGARIGEIGSMQIANVKFDEYGAMLHVEGKTGARPIRVLSSTQYLTTWIQNHPLKNDRNAPLWVNVGTTRHNSAMKYTTIKALLKRLFEKAGIKKRFNPHMFRHSRATFLADHLTEFQMNQYFGWVQGSKMPATYVHMSGKKTDAAILQLNGVNVPKKTKESSLKPIICPRCSTINAHDAKFCNKCAGILDVKTAYELEEKKAREQNMRKKSDDVMDLLMKDSEFASLFVSKIKELGLADKLAG
jgi:integrase/ribosomal protein L40E